nr:MAG: RNA dependent RNA polymerase [Bacteriophage sp.]
MNKKPEVNNEILIKNVDCGLLYFQIKDDVLIDRYESLKARKAELLEDRNKKSELEIVQDELESVSREIHTFKKKDIELASNDNRLRYSGSVTDSLMSRKLRALASEKKDKTAFRTVGESDYTDLIINVKFKQDIMIPDKKPKMGYDTEQNKIVQLEGKKMKRFVTKKKLRKMAYRDGLTINGIHYVNYQRTSSKARTGNCLFIDERYFDEMNEWQNLGIPFDKMIRSNDNDKEHPNPFMDADIVGIRSYQSLTSSSIIGDIKIDPYSILLIDDVSGQYTMDCNVVKLVDKELKAVREPYTQVTDLWDGQSLLDSSLFKKGKYAVKKGNEIKVETYKDYGFILLRNHFFKTAVFNTNLQDYFAERFKGEENPVIYDSFGNPFNPKKVMMVTTRNSVKIFKFADIICAYCVPEREKTRLHELQEKLECANENEEKSLKRELKKEQERLTWNWYRKKIKNQKFGCCKTEHKSKFGDKQQLWYQVIGSLNFNKDELAALAKNQIDEINLMKEHVAWFKRQMGLRVNENVGNTMMIELLQVNDDVARTKWYVDYKRSQIASIIKRLVAGKLQIKNSDFCTLVANPYEMLRASCGDAIESSIINEFECYCTRYKDGEELYGMRSPHICTGNNALLKNTYRDEWKWFNFTDNILIINFWGKGAFLSPTWNGSDTDSDTAFIGNNHIILKKVKEALEKGNYLIPINAIPQTTKKYEFNNEEMAKVDGQLCNDFIGKICNLARDLQSLYFHLLNTGTDENKKKYLPMMYDDICILEVLSNVAIDSAKRRYEVNVESEMKKIKSRPYMTAQGAIIKNDSIIFKQKRYKKCLSENTIEQYNRLIEKRKQTDSEDAIKEINQEIDKLLTTSDEYIKRPDFTKKLKSKPAKKKSKVMDKNNELNRRKQIALAEEEKMMKEKVYVRMQSPMDILSEILTDNIKRSPRTDFIQSFTEILQPIPKGVKADYNRINNIKRITFDGKNAINNLQNDFDAGRKSFDEFYEEKKLIEKDIINEMRKYNVTEWDIHKLIRDVYDIHPLKDKHGKYVKENGKLKMVDKRDMELIQKKVGGLMLQWVYASHRDSFLKTIRDNGIGTVSYVAAYDEEKDQGLKIHEYDGKKYVIRQSKCSCK